MIRPPEPAQTRTTHYSTLAYFPNRFLMIMLTKPDGKLYEFGSHVEAQKFIDANRLGPHVSPVDISEKQDLDDLHIRHAVAEVLARLEENHHG